MRSRTFHRCSDCGSTFPRWAGRCTNCNAWNTLVEEHEVATPSRVGEAERSPWSHLEMRTAVELGTIDPEGSAPVPTGIDEFDRVLGGGLVPGSVTLIGGEPGVGKSTLALQIAAASVGVGRRTLICSAEESAEQVRRRGARLSDPVDHVGMLATTSLEVLLEAAVAYAPEILVVDSIQTIADPRVSGSAGSVSQVRENAAAIISYAKLHGVATVIIGHVTKEGTLAGPRVLEHLVDTVCSFEGDRHHAARVLSVQKNRFGPSGELGIFEMRSTGLIGVADPSAFLLADRHRNVTGTVVIPVLEGIRPVLVELQALVVRSSLATPRRVVQGVTPGRLALIAAVLERRVGLTLSTSDIFASIVGGLRVSEPATDLALGISIASSVAGVFLGDDLVALGEVGLAGELRQVGHTERRLAEAHHHGFRRALVPMSAPEGPEGMELIRARSLGDALEALGVLDTNQNARPTSIRSA